MSRKARESHPESEKPAMVKIPPTRIVLAKVGLDGHDRGIKVVARGLRDLGFHVIYAGLWQSPEAVVRAVADEDADWLGLSLLSGAHMTLVPRVLDLLRQAGLGNVGMESFRKRMARNCCSSALRGCSVRARSLRGSLNSSAGKSTRSINDLWRAFSKAIGGDLAGS
jgi:cobalamin-dependent methionine synthase I